MASRHQKPGCGISKVFVSELGRAAADGDLAIDEWVGIRIGHRGGIQRPLKDGLLSAIDPPHA